MIVYQNSKIKMFHYNLPNQEPYQASSDFPAYDKQVVVYPKSVEPYRTYKPNNVIVEPLLANALNIQIPNIQEPQASESKSVKAWTPEEKPKALCGVDTSSFTIEERLVAAVWIHERTRNRLSIGQIKRDFKNRFEKDPPTKNTLLIWEKKLFGTGNILDAKRSGRPCQRKNHIETVRASIDSSPNMSLRARAAALALPRTTLRKILCEDLRADRQAKKKRAELSGVVKRKAAVRSPKKSKIQQKTKAATIPPPQQQPDCAQLHPPAQNSTNYRGYANIVLPVQQYATYGYSAGDTKQINSNVTSIPHQHYVIHGNIHG